MNFARSLLTLVFFATSAFAGEPKRDRFGDPIPEGAVARLGTINAHPGVRSIAFSADGKELITTGSLRVRYWDIVTGKVKRVVPSPFGTGRRQAISANGKVTAALFDDRIEIREIESNKVVGRVNFPGGIRPGPPFDQNIEVAISPDGRILLAAAEPPRPGKFWTCVWDIEGGRELHWENFEGPLQLLIFSADGRLAAATRRSDSKIFRRCYCWDVKTGKKVTDLDAEDNRSIIAVGPKWQIQRSFEGRWLWLFDNASQKPTELPDIGNQQFVCSVEFSPDGNLLAVSSNQDCIIINLRSGKRVCTIPRGADLLSFSPDGKHLAVYGDSPQVWDLSTGKALMPDVGPMVEYFVSDPAGSWIATSNGFDGRVQIWNTSAGTPGPEIKCLESHDHLPWSPPLNAHSAWLSPDGRRLVGRMGEGLAVVWDLEARRELGRFSLIPERLDSKNWRVVEARVVDAGTIMAAILEQPLPPEDGDRSHVLARWDTRSKKLIGFDKLSGDWSACASAIEPNGMSVLYWGKGSGAQAQNVQKLLLMPDGYRISVMQPRSQSHRMMIGELEPLVKGPEDKNRTEIVIWEPATGKPLLQVPGERDERYDSVMCLSSDGRFLGLGRKKSIELWDLALGKRLPFHKPHWTREDSPFNALYCRDLQFLPDNKHLIAAHGDGTALVWELPPEALKPPSQRMTSRTWEELASIDARVGHNAVWAMWNEPAKALALLKEKLKPATLPPAKDLAAWIEELRAKEYSKRDEAMKNLRTYGQTIESSLREAASRTANAEQKRRLNDLVSGFQSVASRTPEEIRAIRCVQVLEKLKDPQAKQLLRKLAKGEPSAILTQEAKKALQ